MISLPAKHFVNKAGRYLGAFCGIQEEVPVIFPAQIGPNEHGENVEIPAKVVGWDLGKVTQPLPDDPGAIEVPNPPADGRDTWDGEKWIPFVKAPVDLDAELSKKDPFLRALVELIPGGVDAVKAKVATLPESSRLKP